MHGVTISELIKKMKLKNTTPEIDTDKIVLTHPDVNRPALQLTGFFDHFDRERVQIIGYVEQAYINTMDQEQKRRMYDKLTSSQIPCLVFSRDQEPDEDLLEFCNYYGVPCLVSDKTTSALMAEIIRWLNVKLAPCISIHGVLIDVFGGHPPRQRLRVRLCRWCRRSFQRQSAGLTSTSHGRRQKKRRSAFSEFGSNFLPYSWFES